MDQPSSSLVTKVHRVNFSRVFLISSIASLVLSYALLWTRMITNPVENTGADFAAFYAAGRIASNEGPGHVYDLSLQERYEEGIAGFDIAPEAIRPYIHPPFVVPLVQLILQDGYVPSFVLWDVLMVVFIGLGAWPILRLLRQEAPRMRPASLFVSLLLFFPSFLALMYGQDNPILLLGAGLWMLGILHEKDEQAGLGLALMTIRPHLALILAIPFLFRRRRVWWAFLAGTLALALASLLYAGVDGIVGFLRIVLVSAGGVDYSTGENNMVSFIGLALRLFPNAPGDIVRGIGWGLYLVAIAGLCVVWARAKRIGEKELSLAVVLALLFGPHVHIQDLVLLMVPIVGFLLVMIRNSYLKERDMPFVPLLISLAMLLSFSSELLVHNVPYLVMAILLAGMCFPERVAFWAKKASGHRPDDGPSRPA